MRRRQDRYGIAIVVRVKGSTVLAVLAGAGLVAFLIAGNDWQQVVRTVARARWALLLVIALHLPQTLASAWSWQALMQPPRPGIRNSYRLRWIRDSINTLLPVAQVGGDLVRVRLQVREERTPFPVAAGTTMVDVSVEVVAQLAFTLAAVAILLAQRGTGAGVAATLAWSTALGCVAVLGLLVALQRPGLLRFLERAAAGRLRAGAGSLDGIGTTVGALHADRPRLLACAAGHLIAWGLGSVETMAALYAVGAPASFGQAVVIEALGHAARAVGFFIPGALGVQEGGYVLVCGIYGIAAPEALALSMVKRLRELALGVPGLMLWGMRTRRPEPVVQPC